jgi:hypothetical protein
VLSVALNAKAPMPDEDAELYPEQLVAENVAEAVWLRLRRLTSPTLCGRIIAARAAHLPPEVSAQKGREVASSVSSALGYWQSEAASLNAKVLTRYYALLQISIAEQVASPSSTADLEKSRAIPKPGTGSGPYQPLTTIFLPAIWWLAVIEGIFMSTVASRPLISHRFYLKPARTPGPSYQLMRGDG